MAQFPSAGPFNQQAPLVIPGSGIVTPDQAYWFQQLGGQLAAIQNAINNSLGTNFLPLASQPTLGPSDAGYVLYVTDYAHLVYWDGAAWQWMDGDRPGRFDHFAAAPGVGWGLCDGSSYNLLVVGGATLTTSSFTTPNLSGSPAYLKSGAAYTGTIGGAVAPGVSGSTGATAPGTDTQGTHNHTGATGGHTHTFTTGTGTTSIPPPGTVAAGTNISQADHVHSGTTDSSTASISNDGAHSHTVNSHTHATGTLAVDATGEPAKLVALPYVRR